MITLQNITLRHGPHVLLQDASWTIYAKQRIGIIGANGSGKTSLFAMLLGKLQADKGTCDIPKQLKLSHVAQETPAYEKSALDFVLDGDTELRALEDELKLAEERNDGTEMANVHIKLSNIDAYTAIPRAAQLLAGLGFNQMEQQQSVASFSGGWRVRLNLAKALMARSDVLLLDEPTNHLDLDAVIWLEKWLMKYQGTLLLISHDREFLDHTVDHIVHFSQQQLTLYAGNYSSFEKQRAAQLLLQQAAYEKQQKQIAHMQSFVDRFKAKASKAKQAQSRIKAIERLELISAVHMETPLEFQFKTPPACANPLVYAEDVGIGYGEKIVLTGVNISIGPKDRIGVLGPNGAGKSSFIKMLANVVQPFAGIRTLSSGLRIGYFAQHQVDELNLTETPLAHMKELSGHNREQELRTFLGTFGFTGNRVNEPIKNFSGGEKSRLAFALLVWKKPNLLLLDEPTNHLDLDMRHTLNLALQDYDGAVILVSHDRFLVRSTVDQLVLVADGKLQDFSGDINEYEQWLLEYRKQDKKLLKTESNKKSQRQQDAKQKELLQKITRLETELTKLNDELSTVELALADPNIYDATNKEKLQKTLLQQTAIKKRLESTETEWLAMSEQRDSMIKADPHE